MFRARSSSTSSAADVTAAIEQAIRVLRDLSADVRDDLKLDVPTDRKLASAESYAFHHNLVVERPGSTSRRRSAASAPPRNSRSRRCCAPAATSWLAVGPSGKVFEQVDVLVTPTVPIAPPSIARLLEQPDDLRNEELMMLRNTRPFNVWGVPAISVPCGSTRDGMPIGLQIAGPAWREDLVLQVAHAYEQATDWHRRVPALPAT